MNGRGAMSKAKPVSLYKVLVDGKSCSGGDLVWSLPSDGKPGDWHEVEGPLVQCKNGLHLTSDPSNVWRESCRYGSAPEAYLVEAEGVEIGDPTRDWQVVARRVRLLRRLTWAELAEFGITPDGIDHSHKHQKSAAKKRYPAPAPPPERGPSPAMTLMRTVWENRCGANEHSWRRVNSAMHSALMLAITSGLSFAPDDFKAIHDTMRGGYWMGDAENFFRVAVESNHTQACASFEAWEGRKPFLWEGKRLYVGATFTWEGEAVTVTSFSAKDSLCACSYKPRDSHDDYGTRIARRFDISRADLQRSERDRKVELKLAAEATVVQKAVTECRLFVDVKDIMAWTPEQRAEVLEWARTAKGDVGKERVKPPPAPAVLNNTIAAKEARARESEIDDLRREVEQAQDSVEYATAKLQRLTEKLAQAEKAK
jgi:hypothetical protein